MTTQYCLEFFDIEGRYQAFFGKPFSSRKPLPIHRDAIVDGFLRTIVSYYDTEEMKFPSFDDAFGAVVDMYDVYLDALYELSDEEIDELCWRNMVPRSSFDRNVKIAQLYKQSDSEIARAQAKGKLWAFDPGLQAR